MSTTNLNRLKASPDVRLPASSRNVDPSLEDARSAQPFDELKRDSDASRILIVDDDQGVLTLVARMAASLGYRPTIAEDAVDALFHLAKAHFELVITDYEMPFIDGYQLADEIKKKYFGTRVIIMTGHCGEELTEMLDGSGIVDGLLLKPFNLKTMQAKIEMATYPPSGKWLA